MNIYSCRNKNEEILLPLALPDSRRESTLENRFEGEGKKDKVRRRWGSDPQWTLNQSNANVAERYVRSERKHGILNNVGEVTRLCEFLREEMNNDNGLYNEVLAMVKEKMLEDKSFFQDVLDLVTDDDDGFVYE